MRFLLILGLMLIGVGLSLAVIAQGLVQTGRYSAVAPWVTEAQREPLYEVLTLHFPDSVTTVGAAIHAALAGSGYVLTGAIGGEAEALGLLEWPLPDVQRKLGPLTRLAALQTLAGAAFRVSVDPVRRVVEFEFDPEVRAQGHIRADGASF